MMGRTSILGLIVLFILAGGLWWGFQPGQETHLLTASDALAAGNMPLLQKELQQLPDVDSERAGLPLLAQAAGAGNPDAVAMLLKSGAKVDLKLPDGRTPLMLAAYSGNAPTITALLRAGADPNAANAGGWTPLMYAAASGDPDRVRVLLNAGANPLARSGVGNLASELDTAQADPEIQKLLTHAAHQSSNQSVSPRTDDID